jgi:hypothetical protein
MWPNFFPKTVARKELNVISLCEFGELVTKRIDDHDDINQLRRADPAGGDYQSTKRGIFNIGRIGENQVFSHFRPPITWTVISFKPADTLPFMESISKLFQPDR